MIKYAIKFPDGTYWCNQARGADIKQAWTFNTRSGALTTRRAVIAPQADAEIVTVELAFVEGAHLTTELVL